MQAVSFGIKKVLGEYLILLWISGVKMGSSCSASASLDVPTSLIFSVFCASLPSGTVLSMTVKLAEKPSLAMALSVLIVSARMPV